MRLCALFSRLKEHCRRSAPLCLGFKQRKTRIAVVVCDRKVLHHCAQHGRVRCAAGGWCWWSHTASRVAAGGRCWWSRTASWLSDASTIIREYGPPLPMSMAPAVVPIWVRRRRRRRLPPTWNSVSTWQTQFSRSSATPRFHSIYSYRPRLDALGGLLHIALLYSFSATGTELILASHVLAIGAGSEPFLAMVHDTKKAGVFTVQPLPKVQCGRG